MTALNSILDGVLELADEWLNFSFTAKLPLYQHRTAALELNRREAIPSAAEFIQRAYEQIDKNWRVAAENGSYSVSKENWRFTQRPDIAPDNTSAEVGLERSIISAADEHWANQVPTSSGLVGPHTDKVRNIDLVQRDDNEQYTLIELKVESNTPLFAAIEILTYGLLLAWSRKNADWLSYDPSIQSVLEASSVNLCVLAPSTYYTGFNLELLQQAINQGLEARRETLGMPYSFCFTRFGRAFKLDASPRQLLTFAAMREEVL